MMATSTSISPDTGSQFSTSAPAVAAQYESTWGAPGCLRSVGLMDMADLRKTMRPEICRNFVPAASHAVIAWSGRGVVDCAKAEDRPRSRHAGGFESGHNTA